MAAAPPAKLRGHFIPNSHLDREWTLDYQQTRRLTVEFLDRLLEIFDEVPEYTFVLDSQTVPLEDYLEIRPENADRIRSVVQSGRMKIGPWYTAPDDNMLSGESILRNLLAGDRLARKFGEPMKSGYTPFGFGQVSQLPQIYAGFDIDVLFFYRGIHFHNAPESEFVWESPDGTRALCSRFGTKARYNFFMDVWRPVAYGRDFKERVYAWRDQAVPFRLINEDREFDHYFVLNPKMALHRDRLEQSFRELLRIEREHFTTPVIPLMQGMDTTKPDPLEAEIIEELQQFLHPGEEVFFSDMEKYARELKQAVDMGKLRLFRGEMRQTGRPSPYMTLLEHIYSGRVRQKIAHAKAEAILQRRAEPFAALTWVMGLQNYPKTYLDLAWKYLLHCHPHDTIAGCGVDKIERDAMYRLDQVTTLSSIVQDDALGALVMKVDLSSVQEDEIALTVFNPSPRPRTEVVEAYIDIPHNLNVIEYEVADPSGKAVDFQFVYRKPTEKTVRDNTDLTMALVGWMCKTHFVAEDIPGLGWKTYIIRRSDANGNKDRIAVSPHRLENEHLVLEFNPDGTFNMTEKAGGRAWKNQHSFIDEGECGNGWEFRSPALDQIISSRGQQARIALVENSALSATVRVRLTMMVPSGLVHDDTFHYCERPEHEEPIVIQSDITLRKGSRRVDIRTTIDNNARNHRLRACFPTELSAARTSSAETAFDVVEREIDRGPEHGYSMAANPDYPCKRFVDVSDGKHGLALLTEGLHEYEVTDDPSRTIQISLLRAYEVTLCTVSWRWERRPDQELSQVQGRIEAHYALYPHAGNWEQAQVMREVENFELPLLLGQSTGHDRGQWPMQGGLLDVTPEPVLISAVKRAEDRERLVVRLFNSSTKTEKTRVTFAAPVREVRQLNMNEDPQAQSALQVDGRAVLLDITPRRVVTFEVALGEPDLSPVTRTKKSGRNGKAAKG